MSLRFCHLSDTHVRCKWNFIDKTLLRPFTSQEILYLPDPWLLRVGTQGGWNHGRGPSHGPRRTEQPVSNEPPFGKQSRRSLYLTEWPQLPQAVLCCSHSTLFMRPATEFQWGALRYVFPKVASGSRIGYVNGPAAGLYLWFLLISLRLCWWPPWAFGIHLTFRHHHGSKDGLMCVW